MRFRQNKRFEMALGQRRMKKLSAQHFLMQVNGHLTLHLSFALFIPI